uniref:Uncharacterized protein n=1 Tax=Sorghum bicolor TaxID=4558 RepID=C6JS87_SORBI
MCKAVITLSSLVWLRHTLRRWRSRAAVPAGHVAVSVRGGGDGDGAALGPRRFVVRVARLGHPAFRDLLRQAEEEYGFPAGPGPIALPCDEGHFLDVLSRVSSSVASCGLRRCARGESRPLLQGRMAVDHNLVCREDRAHGHRRQTPGHIRAPCRRRPVSQRKQRNGDGWGTDDVVNSFPLKVLMSN